VAENSCDAHIGCLEDEVKKIDERVDRLVAMIPEQQDEQKRHASRELVRHLQDEASEHRKYLALVSSSDGSKCWDRTARDMSFGEPLLRGRATGAIHRSRRAEFARG
jgi:hypothetical protein